MSLTTSPIDLRAPFSPQARSQVVVAPEGSGPGSWAGAPSALLQDGIFYLAYRLRRPIGHGRGFANIVARSRDGVRFETVTTLLKEAFAAESLERPAIAVTPDGTWRAYISAATPGTKHWRVDLIEAPTPEGLATATPRTRRISSGTSGFLTRSSLTTKPARSSAATPSSRIVRVAPQPTSGAFTSA